jgi:hypothetical protein
MKKAILILLALFTTKASAAEQDSYLRSGQTIAGYKSINVNSDGSITVTNPYVLFNGKMVLINGRTAIAADKNTPDATELSFYATNNKMYLTGHGEVICRVAFARKYVSSEELKDRSGFVVIKPIVSLDKDGRIESAGTGYAMGLLTCR